MSTIEEKLDEIGEAVTEIKTVLKGYDGEGGLLRSVGALQTDYFRFKRTVIGVFGFLSGSGLLGAGVWKFLL